MYLYFNDEIGQFGNNSGSYTVSVNNVTNIVPASAQSGVPVGIVTVGSNYVFTASGFCVRDNFGNKTDPDGKDQNEIQASCSSINITNTVCPTAHCFSLVGKIQ